MSGLCPYCERPVSRLTISACVAGMPGGGDFNAISYSCPMCRKIVSVQIDPIAIKTDTVEGVVKELRRG